MRNVDGKIVLFLSSVFYYFGDLLKSANMSFVPAQNIHCSIIRLFINILAILGDFNVTCCVLVNKQAPGCDNFGFHRREILPSRLKGNINSSIKFKNCARIQKIKLK